MSVVISPNVVTNGLILHLDASNTNSYPGSGNIWYDLSGNRNNGTLSGCTYNSENKGSFSFNGSSDYVNVNKANANSSFTINMWINCSDFGSTGSDAFIGLVNNFNGINNQRNRFL